MQTWNIGIHVPQIIRIRRILGVKVEFVSLKREKIGISGSNRFFRDRCGTKKRWNRDFRVKKQIKAGKGTRNRERRPGLETGNETGFRNKSVKGKRDKIRVAISENRHEMGLKRELLGLEIVKRYLLVLVWRGSGEKGFLQALGLIQTYCGRVQNDFRIFRAVVRLWV